MNARRFQALILSVFLGFLWENMKKSDNLKELVGDLKILLKTDI
jgi:hypothetical protein